MEAEFPLQKLAKPVDHHPYRPNPRAQEMFDKFVESMESDGIIGNNPSAWGSTVRIIANADGSPRFCVDYRTTTNKLFVRETWLMPDIKSHIDTVGRAKFTVCGVQSASWQIPIAKKNCHRMAFVSSKCKYVFQFSPSPMGEPWVFQRVMSLAFSNFGQRSGLLVYMDNVIVCSAP